MNVIFIKIKLREREIAPHHSYYATEETLWHNTFLNSHAQLLIDNTIDLNPPMHYCEQLSVCNTNLEFGKSVCTFAVYLIFLYSISYSMLHCQYSSFLLYQQAVTQVFISFSLLMCLDQSVCPSQLAGGVKWLQSKQITQQWKHLACLKAYKRYMEEG